MTVAHTPGPWRFRQANATLYATLAAGRRILAIFRNPISDADGRLMGAAPELLEAALNFKGLYDTPTGRRRRADDPFYAEAVEQLRAAISKATGAPT